MMNFIFLGNKKFLPIVQHCTGALASGDDEVAAEKSRELLEAVQRFTRVR